MTHQPKIEQECKHGNKINNCGNCELESEQEMPKPHECRAGITCKEQEVPEIVKPEGVGEWEELENKLRNLVISGWEMGKEQKLMPYDYRCKSDIAKPVYDYVRQILLQEKAKWTEQIRDEVVKIITKSKATFFVNKGQKCINIPTDEALYELKAEICTAVEMYFITLIDKL